MGSDSPVAPGDVLLDKYRVETVLGRGGMGLVVAARHIDLDELFAIKLMLPNVTASGEAVERFLREARAAAKLKGEHVAKVQDVGRLPDGTPYMVLEHLTGSDLKQRIRRGGPLPVADAITFVLQACETLREAHSLGIVHRDVKPANIFLTHRPNGTPCVKVLDFGISKHTNSDAVGLTTTASVGGSPLYMSPEQMRSAKYVDHRTDIWAIGVVLYELLTGATPFHAETITAVAGRVLQDEPDPPSHLRPEVPASLDAVVLRCLVKRPEGRFQSMNELMDALRAPPSAMVVSGQLGAEPPTLPIGRGSLPSLAMAQGSGAMAARSAPPMPTATTTAGFSQTGKAPQTGLVSPPSRAAWYLAIPAIAILLLGLTAGLLVWLRAPDEGESSPSAAAANQTSPAATAELMPPSTTAPPIASAAATSIATGLVNAIAEPSLAAGSAATAATTTATVTPPSGATKPAPTGNTGSAGTSKPPATPTAKAAAPASTAAAKTPPIASAKKPRPLF